MNDLSNAVVTEQNINSCTPMPKIAIYVLLCLFVIGLSVSLFILVVVHNAIFFVFLLLSAFVVSFIPWNRLNWIRKAAVFRFLYSFPDSDLASALDGQLVKITGLATCGSVSLESSYERPTRCFYAFTLLYEYGRFGLKPKDANASCCQWNLTYCESYGEAGPGCEVVPLVIESKLVTTTRQCRILSSYLRKWLQERNLSVQARILQLEEGVVTVIVVLRKNNEISMIVQTEEILSTGCVWGKPLFPVDVDVLVLGVSDIAGRITIPDHRQHVEQ